MYFEKYEFIKLRTHCFLYNIISNIFYSFYIYFDMLEANILDSE